MYGRRLVFSNIGVHKYLTIIGCYYILEKIEDILHLTTDYSCFSLNEHVPSSVADFSDILHLTTTYSCFSLLLSMYHYLYLRLMIRVKATVAVKQPAHDNIRLRHSMTDATFDLHHI